MLVNIHSQRLHVNHFSVLTGVETALEMTVSQPPVPWLMRFLSHVVHHLLERKNEGDEEKVDTAKEQLGRSIMINMQTRAGKNRTRINCKCPNVLHITEQTEQIM